MATGIQKRKGKIQSINFGDVAYSILSDTVRRTGATYSALINHLVCDVLGADEEIKREMAIHAYQKALELKTEASQTAGFHKKPLIQRSEQYMDLFNLLTLGQDITVPVNESMQRIDLKNGYLLCPDDWIWLDICDPAASTGAIVIEFRNAEKHHLPHFVFAIDGDLNDEIEKAALKAAAAKSQEYKKLSMMYQDPRFDGAGRMLNAKEYNEQPVPGFFSVERLGTSDNYPYGAMIVERSE